METNFSGSVFVELHNPNRLVDLFGFIGFVQVATNLTLPSSARPVPEKNISFQSIWFDRVCHFVEHIQTALSFPPIRNRCESERIKYFQHVVLDQQLILLLYNLSVCWLQLQMPKQVTEETKSCSTSRRRRLAAAVRRPCRTDLLQTEYQRRYCYQSYDRFNWIRI